VGPGTCLPATGVSLCYICQSHLHAQEWLESLGVTDGGLSNLIRATYSTLGLRTYFTTGRAVWLCTAGMVALQGFSFMYVVGTCILGIHLNTSCHLCSIFHRCDYDVQVRRRHAPGPSGRASPPPRQQASSTRTLRKGSSALRQSRTMTLSSTRGGWVLGTWHAAAC
jgi:hypothetical protein